MFVEELTWKQFSTLAAITKLPINEQVRQYNLYLNEIVEARLNYIHHQTQVLGGGKKKVIVPQDEGLPSGCIEFTANTFDSRYFEVIVGTSTETTYTADWGDGTTGEGTLLAEDTATISHEYANDSQEYIIRLCFADASAVTSLEFEGND